MAARAAAGKIGRAERDGRLPAGSAHRTRADMGHRLARAIDAGDKERHPAVLSGDSQCRARERSRTHERHVLEVSTVVAARLHTFGL